MSPELFASYSQMRSNELQWVATRERVVTAALRRRRDTLIAAVGAWFDELRNDPFREVEPCPTC